MHYSRTAGWIQRRFAAFPFGFDFTKCRFCFCLLSEPRKWICLFLRFDYYDLCGWMWLRILLQFTFYLFTHWNIAYFAALISHFAFRNLQFSLFIFILCYFCFAVILFRICVACAFEVMFNERFYCIVDDVVKYFLFITTFHVFEFFVLDFEKYDYCSRGINGWGNDRLLLISNLLTTFWHWFDLWVFSNL